MGRAEIRTTRTLQFPGGSPVPDPIRAGVEARLGRTVRMLVETPPRSAQLVDGEARMELVLAPTAVTTRDDGRVGLEFANAVERTLLDLGGVNAYMTTYEVAFEPAPAPTLDQICELARVRLPSKQVSLSSANTYAAPIPPHGILEEGLLALWDASLWLVRRDHGLRVATLKQLSAAAEATVNDAFKLLEELGGHVER